MDSIYQTLCVDTWFGVILFSMHCCAASIHHIATGQNSKTGEECEGEGAMWDDMAACLEVCL